jgi:putative membrane-bound dehydrogenase-like protein
MLRRLLLVIGCLPLSLSAADVGTLPVGADGKPLNLDFETGTLKDWTATGVAFKDQPIKGDAVAARRTDMKSGHQGDYWIGTYERVGDRGQGTLTSVPFKVTQPWASFLIGGGSQVNTCVELLANDKAFFKTSGLDDEQMKYEIVDLKKYLGQEIQIRLVDKNDGGWGHINFDNFRLHADKPKLPARVVKAPAGPPDVYKNAGLTPEKAAVAMTVPEDFTVNLFAGEPDVHQPVGFCIDERGRLWVAEAFIYPKRDPSPGPLLPEAKRKDGDRILILEDTDGDGKFDKKTTFIEGLNLVSGIEVGFGGVWIGAAPYLMFIPDRDGDDKPDGPPEILLDGWHYEDTHETLNSFIWGPDGWLYGCHGVFTYSRVGKPGTPDKERIPINAGIWRYHPTKHLFEVFAEGSSNPWGLDYNDQGDFFIEACVIPHCFHIIQGARYLRQAGSHYNPYTYADIGTIADHLHYVGANPHGGNNRSDSAGGGHAHCGLMCYLGGTWPEKYRGQLFMGNIHGRRLNMDIPRAKGSGYVAGHGPDFLLANDEWARFINYKSGPDGNVYMIDWYDKQACHRNEPEIWDRTNGRVYKISYRGAKSVTGVDLRKNSDEELVKFQLSDNDWYVRNARRVLQERASQKALKPETSTALAEIAFTHPNPTKRLRGLWALHAVNGGLTPEWETRGLKDESEFVKAWTIQFIAESKEPARSKAHAEQLQQLAKNSTPVVRRYLASALQRQPVASRVEILRNLLAHAEDASDFNLPLMYWYALEPLAGENPKLALELASNGKIPMLLQFTARRIATNSTKPENELLASALSQAVEAKKPESAVLILRGITEGFRGRKGIEAPGDWSTTSDKLAQLGNKDVQSLATSVAISFGDPKAFAIMRHQLADPQRTAAERQDALTALVSGRDKELAPLLQQLVSEAGLRGAALRALAGYDDAKTPAVIFSHWKNFKSEEVRDALNTLASRPVYAKALLDAVASKQVQPSEITADVIRAMRNLPDEEVAKKIATVWGAVRETPADRLKAIAQWRKKLSVQGKDDLSLGRALYAKTCQQCHTLYGIGGKIGPDITGSNRVNLDYLLENVFDPSAVIPKDYAQSVLSLSSGRTVTGIVKGDNGTAYTVQTPNEVLLINKSDVDELKPSTISMMPEDQMKPFSDAEVRALFAYLRHNQQVPQLATVENAKDLFNGKDLTGWIGDPKLWSVENGELVGKSPGLKHNEFLRSELAAENFKLSLKVKLAPNKENSGIQFRSVPATNGEMKGPQADIGAGWWGKLYEELGRGLLAKEGGEKFVKPDEWNDYLLEAVDGHIRISINGHLCTDYQDDQLARRGLFAFQLHSGGPLEVRFKEIKLEVLPKK